MAIAIPKLSRMESIHSVIQFRWLQIKRRHDIYNGKQLCGVRLYDNGRSWKIWKIISSIMSVIKHEITCMKSTCYATVYTYNPNHLISLERERRHMNSVSSLATIDYSIVLPHCIY